MEKTTAERGIGLTREKTAAALLPIAFCAGCPKAWAALSMAKEGSNG